MESLCVAPRQQSENGERCGRQSAPGLRVCAACRQRIRGTLAELPQLYLACESTLGRQPRSMMAEKVSGSRLPSLPINERAATARTDLVRVMAAWAGMAADEFDLTGPSPYAVDKLATFLSRQLDRLLSHPAAGDFVAELSSVAGAARRAAHGDSDRRLDVGCCTHVGCDSRITVRIHGHDPTPHHVRCDAGHTWPPQQWLQLARRLERAKHMHDRGQARSARGDA